MGGGCTKGVVFECKGSASCFMLCEAPTHDHAGATSACAAWGGRMAVVNSSTLNECLVAHIQSASVGTDVWMGLTQPPGQSSPELGWTWSDGSALVYHDWYMFPTQPNDNGGGESDSEQCGDFDVGFGFHWNDDGCGQDEPYFCEIPR